MKTRPTGATPPTTTPPHDGAAARRPRGWLTVLRKVVQKNLLADGLRENQTLRSLQLNGNPIGDKGVVIIIEVRCD